MSLFLASCAVNAGSMGPVATPGLEFFVSGEGGYTWNQLGGFVLSTTEGTIFSKENNQGGTARVAVGAIHPVMNNLFSMSGEIGWGYYGKTSYTANTTIVPDPDDPNSRLSINNYLYGFDILAGATYHFNPQFDLFFKAGALIENQRVTFKAVDTLDTITLRLNQTEALPVIKLGGAYNMWDNLALFAAWTHAFGDSTKLNARMSDISPANFNDITDLLGSANINSRNATLDTVTAGLQYKFS